MDYRRLAPDPILRDFVEAIWVQDLPGASRQRPSWVLPTGTVELLFQYRDPLAHVEKDGDRSMPLSYVTGQRTRPVLPVATGDTGIVLVSLFPWTLPRLFRAPPSELVDGYTDLRLLLPRDRLDRLEESLSRAGASARVELVQALLADLLRRERPDARIRRATERLAKRDAPPGISGLASELGWSPRTFRRRFHDEVGIAPKTFQRIMRFQHALRLGRAGRGWSRVAADCHYSDQAHLIREMREFSGRTPGRLPGELRRPLDLFNGPDASRFFSTVYQESVPQRARTQATSSRNSPSCPSATRNPT